MGIVIVWLLFAVVTSVAASNRNRSPGTWFAIGFLLGPFGLILVLVMRPGDPPAEQVVSQVSGETKQCPSCAKRVRADAIRCLYCERLIPSSVKPVTSGKTITHPAKR